MATGVGINQSLTMMVYGPSKAGKSTLAVTAPYPRLLLDVESAHRFLPIVVKYWDPLREEPPVADGTWDTCVVPTRNYDTMLSVYRWLQSGQHQFKSLIVDSVSELQVKCLENIAGANQMTQQQWGELLRHMGQLLRDLRDLTMHPTNPLSALVLTAMERPGMSGTSKPYLQGQIGIVAPYLYDVLGYLRVEEYPHPDPLQPPYKVRRLYVEATSFADAGERVQGRLGSIVEQHELNVETMIQKIYSAGAPGATEITANTGTTEIGAA